jgi:hypothetical protein
VIVFIRFIVYAYIYREREREREREAHYAAAQTGLKHLILLPRLCKYDNMLSSLLCNLFYYEIYDSDLTIGRSKKYCFIILIR